LSKEPRFLTLAEILRFHDYQIKRFGGETGIRDAGLLESAIAQPEATFGGQWLHRGLYTMASAYAFHICKNHPFLDGNKRTALVAALVFLEINGVSIFDPEQKLPGAVEAIATGGMSKEGFSQFLESMPKEA
jgi:death on curing protein